ncbi:hypothetical protein MKEN_00784600 [Mycena kentingensis (nom. inval.)]|nr:hypothetical protein MKEN_00784600 [Mycena kentingensis (nom. inval.)]
MPSSALRMISVNQVEFPDADFTVRSMVGPNPVRFEVNRAKLQAGSGVFRDMFACCTPGTNAAKSKLDWDEILDLYESEASLTLLFRLLHTPPDPPSRFVLHPSPEKAKTHLPARYDVSTAIPLPVLRLILALADKYALEAAVLECLEQHLVAHAQVAEHALEVYCLALSGDGPLQMPRGSRGEPVRVAVGVLSQLQAYRVKALQDILLHEDLFPHGYGTCPSHEDAAAIWERTALILAPKVESNTDIGGEMESLKYIYQSCPNCMKAATAATEMLSYKARRVPRRLDQLPEEV